MSATALDALSSRPRSALTDAPPIPQPQGRWITRLLLPLVILALAALLVVYAGRDLLLSSVDVWVVPVVGKPAQSLAATMPSPVAETHGQSGAMIAQAPGWIEPEPYAINISALIDGVVSEMNVLEGDSVLAGQVVARLVDADARLALLAAESELATARVGVVTATFDRDAAAARHAELSDRLTREQALVKAGGAAGELAQMGFRARAVELESSSATALIDARTAAVARQSVAVEEARLRLARTEIRSPCDGVVLTRLIEPGMRVSMQNSPRNGVPITQPDAAGLLLRLYNPQHLQVRTEIPLADSAKLVFGCAAEITTEALPDTPFAGTITRIVHEANIQRNTLQVKVRISNPHAALKPEMLTRVRLYAPRPPSDANPISSHDAQIAVTPAPRLFIHARAILNQGGTSAEVWVARKSDNGASVAHFHKISVAPTAAGDMVEVVHGLRLGDRVIVDPPPQLTNGARVRVVGERVFDGGAPQ